jgi:hypothetical protein
VRCACRCVRACLCLPAGGGSEVRHASNSPPFVFDISRSGDAASWNDIITIIMGLKPSQVTQTCKVKTCFGRAALLITHGAAGGGLLEPPKAPHWRCIGRVQVCCRDADRQVPGTILADGGGAAVPDWATRARFY